jgi:hypothetical protein
MRARGRQVFRERFTLEAMIAAYQSLYAEAWAGYEHKRTRGRQREAVGEN